MEYKGNETLNKLGDVKIKFNTREEANELQSVLEKLGYRKGAVYRDVGYLALDHNHRGWYSSGWNEYHHSFTQAKLISSDYIKALACTKKQFIDLNTTPKDELFDLTLFGETIQLDALSLVVIARLLGQIRSIGLDGKHKLYNLLSDHLSVDTYRLPELRDYSDFNIINGVKEIEKCFKHDKRKKIKDQISEKEKELENLQKELNSLKESL